MALNVHEFVKDPPYPPRVDTTPSRTERRVSVREAKTMMRARVGYVAERSRGLFHLAPTVSIKLYEMNDGELGRIEYEDLVHQPNSVLLDAEKGQAALLEVLGEYGFDPQASREINRLGYDNGSFRVVRVYPSQTVRGLKFERYAHVTGMEQPISVYWRVKK
jgi:hypothetical protein